MTISLDTHRLRSISEQDCSNQMQQSGLLGGQKIHREMKCAVTHASKTWWIFADVTGAEIQPERLRQIVAAIFDWGFGELTDLLSVRHA